MTDMKDTKAQGFTLTELMFAMGFVSFLLIFSVVVIIHVTQLYNKGLAVRQITQSGRQLSEDMSRTLRYASAKQIVNYNAVSQRLCANGVSYVWNIGDAVTAASQLNKYAPPNDNEFIKLIRVRDPSGNLCNGGVIVKADARDMVTDDLSVQCFDVSVRESGRIVSAKAVISTGRSNKPNDVIVSSTSVTCQRGGGPVGIECPLGNEGAFCAFGQFQVTSYVRN